MYDSGGLNDIQVTQRKIQVHRTLHFPWIPLWLSWKRIYLQCGRPGFDLWVGKIPWMKAWQSAPVFLPREYHGQKSLVGYSPWGRKESNMIEQLALIVIYLPSAFVVIQINSIAKSLKKYLFVCTGSQVCSYLIRDGSWAPRIGRTELQFLDPLGSPWALTFVPTVSSFEILRFLLKESLSQ